MTWQTVALICFGLAFTAFVVLVLALFLGARAVSRRIAERQARADRAFEDAREWIRRGARPAGRGFRP